MSTQVQYRRGTSTENNAFTGALSEITVDTTNWTLRVHDGTTAGGAGNVATVAYVSAQLAALSANAITFGTSNVQIPESNGNIRINVGGTSNVAVFNTAGANVTGNLNATGNITGSYILGNGSQLTGIDATSIQSGTSNVRVQTSNGNVSVGVDGSAIIRFTTAGIVNDMGNGAGNIGNATGYFNTIFAKATSAQYADVAEYYSSDQNYTPGTVIVFGGNAEVTASVTAADNAVAGVVSTNPAYIMNTGIQCQYSVPVALTGRVPTKVLGSVRKGNMMVSAPGGYAQACATPAIGTVIGKAVENFDGKQGIIEVVIGRV